MDTSKNDVSMPTKADSLAEKLKKAEQAAARATARVARLKNAERQALTGQAIVVGLTLIAEAKSNSEVAAWLVQTLEAKVKRPADLARVAPLIEELKASIPANAGGAE